MVNSDTNRVKVQGHNYRERMSKYALNYTVTIISLGIKTWCANEHPANNEQGKRNRKIKQK
jgi:hypothetical protein